MLTISGEGFNLCSGVKGEGKRLGYITGKGINPYPVIGENQGHYPVIKGKGLNSTLPLLFEDFVLRGLINDLEYVIRLQKPIKFAR